MAARYLGPAKTFVFQGKAYQRGDTIPISKQLQEHHARYGGHRFEGLEEETVAAPATAPTVPPEPKK